LEELAQQCGLDPMRLLATINRFNAFARKGVDQDFHRGCGAFDRFFGDPTVAPNPNLGTLERAPFYAVRAWPGDVGTYGGLIADEFARVLREDGSVIAGLYATGNSTASVMGRSYPGAGASIAASMVFGYLAAHDALGQARSASTVSEAES
jgi:3-oxosteroid 1-dehydrogenase